MPEPRPSRYHWFILAILTAIGTFVAAIPVSCMPVLFKEISEDLGLDIVQLGGIWGIASLAGIFVSILGGILSDRLDVKLFLGILCILTGVTGALRGLADSFFMLSFTVFLNGIIRLIVPVNTVRMIGLWFRGRNLGMAQGIGAMGMGLGLMLGPLISATVLSPWLGGWRNVMYFYGGISALIGVLWLIFGRAPDTSVSPADAVEKVDVKQAFSRLVHNKAVWLLAVMLFFRVASIMGVTGYIPTYLKNLGWAEGSADGVLAIYYAVSTIFVVPLSSLSDRIGLRKPVLLAGLVVSMFAFGLIPFVDGAAVWVMMSLAGFFMDGFMAIFTTMLLETEGVGPKFSGLAIGIVFTVAQIGSVISPPLGNSLAGFGRPWPFIFWAAMGMVALVPFLFTRETGRKATDKYQVSRK